MGQDRVKVGLFVTLSFFLFASALLWLAGSRFFQPVDTYTILFTESVSGLLPGAAVEYQGVTVGKVETIGLTQDTPPRAQVAIALQPGTPIRQDTTAHLIGSFVTGIRYIELAGGSSVAPILDPGAVIPVQRGGLEEFRDRAGAIAERLLDTLTRIEQGVLSEHNLTALTDFLKNMSRLTQDLRTSLAEVSTPDTRLALRQMVENLAQAAAGLKSATAAINTIREELFQDGKAMLVQIRHTAEATADLANDVRRLTQHVDELVVDNRQEVRQVLSNLSHTSHELRELSESLRADPSSLVWGPTVSAKEIPDP